MKRPLLVLVLAIAAALMGVALSLFGVITLVALACAESARSCGFVSLFIGFPAAMVGVGVLIEFWGRKD